MRAFRRFHRWGDCFCHSGRCDAGCEASAGVAHAYVANSFVDLRHRAWLDVDAQTSRIAGAGAHSADRSRHPQLAQGKERVPGHRCAAGRCKLDLPAAHGRAGARQSGSYQRASAVEPPWRQAVRLRHLGIGAGVTTLCVAQQRCGRRRYGVLDRASPFRADSHYVDVGARRSLADRFAAADPG